MSRTADAPGIDELRSAWSTRRSFNATLCGGRAVMEGLADGTPVTPGALATATGLALDVVAESIRLAGATGVETDDGAIVGAALTLRPTPHQFRVRGHDLYTWCGFDALFVPIVLGELAEVVSACPATGAEIRLTVGPDGTVSKRSPDAVVVGIVGREVLSCCSTTGPGSDVCSQMPFFASHDAAERWLGVHPGVAIVDLDTARPIAAAFAATFP